jgi:hypothetical protein
VHKITVKCNSRDKEQKLSKFEVKTMKMEDFWGNISLTNLPRCTKIFHSKIIGCHVAKFWRLGHHTLDNINTVTPWQHTCKFSMDVQGEWAGKISAGQGIF